MKRIVFACVIVGLAMNSFAEPDFNTILKEVDSLGTFREQDFSCEYTFVSKKPGEETEFVKARMFRRDLEKNFVLLILEPEYQRGEGFLKINENIWFYDPESRKFTHSSLRENVQNSEAKPSDVDGFSLSEEYVVKSYEIGSLGSFETYIIQLTASNDNVSYPGLKVWIRTDQTMLLKAENYSLSNRLMRTVYYPRYVKIGSNYVPSKILIVDNLNNGEETQITMKAPSTTKLPDSVFSKVYLEMVNN